MLDAMATPTTSPSCLFCQVRNPEINTVLLESSTFYVRRDNFPAAAGHVEVVPKRHVESYFDLTDEEAAAAHSVMRQARRLLDAEHHPDGYTIGVNDGRAAGRTIDHLHIHLIPRYNGDVADPRGGVRHVLPGTDVSAWTS
jgi:diadenosine tetraphosphate (Ap4A) HIT family hydrolase